MADFEKKYLKELNTADFWFRWQLGLFAGLENIPKMPLHRGSA